MLRGFEVYSFLLLLNDIVTKSKEQNLSLIWQPIWDYLVAHCSSFANPDFNAEFSQIFSGHIIENLTDQESDLFETRYTLEGNCSNCGEALSLRYRKLLNNVSELNLRT